MRTVACDATNASTSSSTRKFSVTTASTSCARVVPSTILKRRDMSAKSASNSCEYALIYYDQVSRSFHVLKNKLHFTKSFFMAEMYWSWNHFNCYLPPGIASRPACSILCT